MLYTYDDSQLAEIRKIIAGLARLTPDDIAVRDTAVADGKCSVALWPLWPLALTDPALWSTVVADDRIGEFSVYGLFPAAYDIVYGDYHQATEVRYDGGLAGVWPSSAVAAGGRVRKRRNQTPPEPTGG